MVMNEKRYLKSYECLIYDRLYELPEFESFREQGKEFFIKKYNIDYISMHIINRERNLIFFRMDNEKWHQWLGANKLDLSHLPILVNNLENLAPNQMYLEYFDTYIPTEPTLIRAEIFGVRKYGGCEIIMTNENNDIIVYSITFKDDKSLGLLPQNILNELIKDLGRYRNLFTPFIRYGEMGGDFFDKKKLNPHLENFKNNNRSLFYLK
jgi:hypothetical protein